MKLEEQVTSLELSKKLKELGVEQNSLFKWRLAGNTGWQIEPRISPVVWDKEYPSYSVAELGEMLPDFVNEKILTLVKDWTVVRGKKIDAWIYFYSDTHSDKVTDCIPNFHSEKQTNEANARAKLLIYLIENKLI